MTLPWQVRSAMETSAYQTTHQQKSPCWVLLQIPDVHLSPGVPAAPAAAPPCSGCPHPTVPSAAPQPRTRRHRGHGGASAASSLRRRRKQQPSPVPGKLGQQ